MTDVRRVLFVLGAIGCLIVVASALPAADPRLDGVGTDAGGTIAGQWSPDEPTPEQTTDQPDREDRTDDDSPIEIQGSPIPGTKISITADSEQGMSTERIEVNGEVVGETFLKPVTVRVPYAETMTVSITNTSHSRTVYILTDASISLRNGPVPGGSLGIRAEIGSDPVSDATVLLDGETVTNTSDNGNATLDLPPSAGPVEIAVERGPVAGSRTVTVPEPTARFTTPALFPGFSAPVTVSAGGMPIEDAPIEIDGTIVGRTDEDGRATIQLPIEDAVTITTRAGDESATTTVEHLYLRLAAVVVIPPGLVIGLVLIHLRVISLSRLLRFPTIGRALAGTAGRSEDLVRTAVGAPFSLGNWLRSVSPLSGRSGDRSSPGFGGPSLGSLAGSLPSLGSLSSLFGGDSGSNGRSPGANTDESHWLDDAADDAAESEGDGDDGVESAPSPRGEILAAWHSFLDRLGVRRRESATPGSVARTAVDTGFPAEKVRGLLGIVRNVEYGGRDPSPERVERARSIAEDLRAVEVDDDAPRSGADDSQGGGEP